MHSSAYKRLSSSLSPLLDVKVDSFVRTSYNSWTLNEINAYPTHSSIPFKCPKGENAGRNEWSYVTLHSFACSFSPSSSSPRLVIFICNTKVWRILMLKNKMNFRRIAGGQVPSLISWRRSRSFLYFYSMCTFYSPADDFCPSRQKVLSAHWVTCKQANGSFVSLL